MMMFEKMELYYHKQPVDGATHQLYNKAKGQTTVRKHILFCYFYIYFLCQIYIFCL